MLVIAGHILAVRGPSLFFDVYPGFAGLAFTIEFLPGHFYPYYFALGLAGFYHALNGASIALGRLGIRFALPQRHLTLASSLAALAMVVSLLGLGGVWFDVGDPWTTWPHYFRRRAPSMKRWSGSFGSRQSSHDRRSCVLAS